MSELANDYDRLSQYLRTEKSKIGVGSKTVVKTDPTPELRDHVIKDKDEPGEFEFNNKHIKDFNDVSLRRLSGKFSKDKFLSNIKKSVVESIEAKLKYKRKYIYLTEMLMCTRQVYFSFLKYPFDIDQAVGYIYSELMAEVGQLVHEYVYQNYDFDRVEFYFKNDEINVSMRVDANISDTIYDIKTIDIIPKNARKKDALQLSITAYILNKYDDDIKDDFNEGCIIYVPRSLRDIQPVDIEFDFVEVEKRMVDLKYLQDCINQQKIPEPRNCDDDTCRYCLYSSYCDIGTKFKGTQRKNSFVLL